MIKEIYDIFENLKKQGKKDDDFKIDFLAKELLKFKSEIDKLNFYEKLNLIKFCLLKLKLEKTGKAKGKSGELKYEYFTLDKLEPPIIILSNIFNLSLKISCEKDDLNKIKLVISNSLNKDEYTEYILPFPYKFLENIENKDIRLVSSQNIQNLGATSTYMRRYLYLSAFDIIEPDEIEIENDESWKKTTNNFSKNKQKIQYNSNEKEENNDIETLNFEGYFIKKGGSFKTQKGENRTYCYFKTGVNEKQITAILDDKKLSGLIEGNLYEITLKKYGDNYYCTEIKESINVPF